MTTRQAPAPAPSTPSAPRRRGLGAAYAWWLASDTASALSTSLAGFAIPLLALGVTGSPAQAGVIGAVGLAVRALATAAGGVLADRHDRLRLMIAGGLIGIVLAVAFTVLTLGPALGFASLLAVNALLAARNGAFGTAASAALKDVVPASALGRAQASNQGRDAVIALGGAPLGGLLLGAGGWLVGAVMILCQLVATIAAGALRALRRRAALPDDAAGPAPESAGPGVPADAAAGHGDPTQAGVTPATPAAGEPEAPGEHAPSGSSSTPRRSARAELAEACAWLWRRPDLRGALLVCTIVNLGFNAVVTTVIYSLQQGGTPPATIGLVSTGIGAGMLAGALAAPFLVAKVPAGLLTGLGLVLVTASTLALPWLHSPAAVGAVLAVGMAGTPALNAALLGYFMVATPSHLMGRATSVLDLFATGAMPLAPLLAGLGLALLGRGPTLLIGAGLCAVSAALALGTRQLRRLPAESGWVAHAAAITASAEPASSTHPAVRPPAAQP